MPSTRRLAAIMFTDMVGSTALAQINEAEALRLRDEQAGLVRPLFAVHQGREIKSMGDGFLAEFDSALRAVQCAIDIQQHLAERNARPGVVPIQLRIGVHLGDVEQRESDIFGDAVNIASRIEPLAYPGGVCISGEVFSQVRNKIPNKLERLPPTVLKGVRAPMDIYRVVLAGTSTETSSEGVGSAGLAVLPFANISPDPKDEYFADGLTEELITVLSQLRDLRVIARTSVTPYKSTSKGVSQIGTELGVSSILEGSVRKAGNRLRITVQLIDVGSQGHVWAKSYDRELDDIFAVQTDVATQVAETLKIELRATETARLAARPAVRPDSYLAYLKGRAATASIYADYQEVKGHFERAIALDPGNAAAYSGLADVIRSGQSEPRWEPTSRDLARRALEIDPALPEAHVTLGDVHLDDLAYSSAEGEYRTAISLNPSLSGAHMSYGWLLALLARPEEALLQFRLAEAADPLNVWAIYHAGTLEVWAGKLDEARGQIEKLRGATEQFKKIGTDRFAQHCYHHGQARIFRASSDRAGCAREIGKVVRLERDPRLRLIYRAWRTTIEGRPADARALLREADAESKGSLSTSAEAYVFAELHDLDDCFRRLNDVSRPWTWLHEYRLDPLFAHVRTDPRFDTLLRRLRLP